jgi:hypothetical protein
MIRKASIVTGTAGAGLIATGLTIAPATVDVILVALGALLALLAGNEPQPPKDPPRSARDMLARSLALVAFAGLLSGCGHNPPGPPAHIETRATVEGTGLDVTTRWLVCATDRVCAYVDVGILWAEDGRAVCIELPEYGLVTCHAVEVEDAPED